MDGWLRYYAGALAGNSIRLSVALPSQPHGTCIKPSVQCPRFTSMRRFPPRYKTTILEW